MRHLHKVVLGFVVVLILGGSLALLGCGGDDEGEIKDVNVTVDADDVTVPAVQGRPFTFANGQVFGGNIGNLPVILTFTTPRAFTLTRAATGLSLSGTVSYGDGDSCTFTVTTGGQGALSISSCDLLVIANDLVVGIGTVIGTISLTFRNDAGIAITSDPLPATVFINGDGELFVVNPVTGLPVNMGIEP
jgi:hypothetical protein